MASRRIPFVILAAIVVGAGVVAAEGQLTATPAVASPADLIAVLSQAYRTLDLALYSTLFAHAPEHGVGYRFILERPSETGETSWDYDEEMRIHRRMFNPASIGGDEKPLPKALWVRSIDVELVRLTPFAERFDLYRSEQNPTGELDRKLWRATDAVYATDVTWHTRGGQMRIVGQARFIVIEDLLALVEAENKFLIYRWEDLGSGDKAVAQSGS